MFYILPSESLSTMNLKNAFLRQLFTEINLRKQKHFTKCVHESWAWYRCASLDIGIGFRKEHIKNKNQRGSSKE
jgi:hypothetical protein